MPKLDPHHELEHHGLHEALESHWGGDRGAYLEPYDHQDVRWWRCPACTRGAAAVHLLVVPLDPQGTAFCLRGCTDNEVWRSMGNVTVAPAVTPTVALEDTGSTSRGRVSGNTGRTSFSSPADVLPVSLEENTGPAIDRLAKDEDTIAAVCKLWSITIPLGRNFKCRLEGHERDASFYLDQLTGTWKYRCWCQDRFWSLAEVRAAMATGNPKKLANPSATVWFRRLWWEATLIDLAPVDLAPLPAAADPMLRAVWRGFQILVGLRWLTHDGQPVPFGRVFAGHWAGVTSKRAYRAIHTLLEHEIIELAETIPNPSGPGHTHLYLPTRTMGAHGMSLVDPEAVA